MNTRVPLSMQLGSDAAALIGLFLEVRPLAAARDPVIACDRTMPTTDEILDSIEKRLRELRVEIETLTAARIALHPAHAGEQPRPSLIASNGRDAGPETRDASRGRPEPRQARAVSGARSRPADRGGRQKRGSKARRSVDVVPAGKLELLLAVTSGLATSELADRANGDRNQVLLLLRELEASGRVRRTAERRGTRWHVITDDDRIQQRVAELAALSNRRA